MEEEFKVTPWEVSGEIDYERLMRNFGTTPIDDALLQRLAGYGEVHPMLRRGVFYCHRDLNQLLDRFDRGERFFLYTGRGPSGSTHLGHLMPWIFTKWLQDTFRVPLLFQMTDDEKFLFKDLSLDETRRLSHDNALDFAALGFDPELTEIILDTENIRPLYPIALKVAKKVTFSTARAVFGFDNSSNIGAIFFTTIQAAPAFLPTEQTGVQTPCLIPCGIDQDPHFRVARDVAPGLGYPKPAMLYCKMFPGLGGGDKMSSSDPMSTIYTTDTPKEVRRKVGRAFTGGRVTVEEQRELGGDPEVCAVFMYNFFLFEPDDAKLDELAGRCRRGEVLCGECKAALTERINVFLEGHQARREQAREVVDRMTFEGFKW
jgi:tryptophanyl-tRNA synthetase